MICIAIALWVGVGASAVAQCDHSSNSVNLGTTGIKATLLETNTGDTRRLILTQSNGKRHVLRLQHDRDGNNSTNLYFYSSQLPNGQVVGSGYIFISRKDCVEMDSPSFDTRICNRSDLKRSTLSYMGRYDWMNGFDNGTFGLEFRYSDFSGAIEDQSVWQEK
jgi:hypothetical protein